MDVSSKTVILINVGAAFALISLLSVRFWLVLLIYFSAKKPKKAALMGCFFTI
ncbi:Uncharacterised protein [Raoultella terrigena]|nr:Uncharacterised protein [Raoultella terrigena]